MAACPAPRVPPSPGGRPARWDHGPDPADDGEPARGPGEPGPGLRRRGHGPDLPDPFQGGLRGDEPGHRRILRGDPAAGADLHRGHGAGKGRAGGDRSGGVVGVSTRCRRMTELQGEFVSFKSHKSHQKLSVCWPTFSHKQSVADLSIA